MTDFPYNCVGFDLDGTLLDTFRDLGEAVNHALSLGAYRPVPVDTSKDLIGGGAKAMLAQAVQAQGGIPGGLEGDDFRALYKGMLRYYAENNAVHSKPYRHAREVVAELSAQGIKVAVVTNKFEKFARSILSQLDFLEPFETVIGGDSMGKNADGRFLSKPHPEPVIEANRRCGGGTMLFVGDSTYDVAAAKAANVPIIAAAYGYCDKPPSELGADAVIDSLDQLIPAALKLHSGN
ncbi:HAD-IA family hydrolase [Erythrobacter sp. YT30]|uniref:HAD-IA family hydrolase n=1 Tax=Erythrobacter sp. YT30 TaxID=1735012 RepID=UPI00076D1E5E|nr:HAD-IA family hydrolase [Erythrobacter sp. YT30]KWV90695.1 phosphoglycolate phosphatase [Erythrobacter sp. YT30]